MTDTATIYIDKAIKGLEDPDFTRADQFNEYAKLIRQALKDMVPTEREHTSLVRKFNTALLIRLMGMQNKNRR